MNNLLKNSLLALTLVCVVALIVFCIQLIIINRDVDRVTPGTVITTPDEDGENIENGEEMNDDDTQNNEAAITFPGVAPQHMGERHEILITPNSHLVLYAHDDQFVFEDGELDWAFRYIDANLGNIGDYTNDDTDNFAFGRTAALEITFKFITVQGIETHAVDFLNQYSGSQASVFNGMTSIMGTRLMGYHVTTSHLGRTYEAWIHTLLDSDVSLVFVLNYENDMQREALYQVLRTADIVAIGLEAPETNEPEAGETGENDQVTYGDDQLPEDED